VKDLLSPASPQPCFGAACDAEPDVQGGGMPLPDAVANGGPDAVEVEADSIDKRAG